MTRSIEVESVSDSHALGRHKDSDVYFADLCPECRRTSPIHREPLVDDEPGGTS